VADMRAILNCVNRLDINASACVQISVLANCLLSGWIGID
jgi:hypothetical protein